MLHLYQSNRLEVLAEALARLTRAAPLPPLQPETIVVASGEMGRWLTFALAERNGIAANLRLEFAASLVWKLIRAVLPAVPEASPLEPEVLRWRLFALLPEVPANDGDFAAVHRYLSVASTLMRFELAAAAAESFDRYLVYRPDWIEAWGRGARRGLGAGEGWQARLWRDVATTLPQAMRTHPREQFFAALERDPALRCRLPVRIHLFALSALPPLYLDLFRRLADHLDVHLYALNPCRAHWGDIVQRRQMALAAATGKAEHLEVGNSLLASLGRHARATLDELAALDSGDEHLFVDPGRATLLAHLQADILELAETPGAHAATDDSLAIHVCHSATREVEVLHDRLLDLFARDPTLSPSDVLVLVPQIEAYAPGIEAVFAAVPAERRIPFSIADRAPATSGMARVLHSLIALSATRHDAESVLALLEAPAVGRRFDIRAAELALLREWVRDSGIRWGRDERARTVLGLPGSREHTWDAGLNRLLLGYAMPGESRHTFGGVLPFDDIEGGTAALAGRLKTFVDAALTLAEELREPRPMSWWRRRFERVLAELFAPDEEEARELIELRAAFAQLEAHATAGGAHAAVPVTVFEREWVALIERRSMSRTFLGGGATFAALLPARAVPARVVALLGMNDGVFPRQHRPASFDLMTDFPRQGDRVGRAEDRHAFLEALLGAREHLYISYTGRSVRDNEPLPPSPLVAELVEAARRAFSADVVAALTIEHPLQAFSRRYFDGSSPELFSYAATYATTRGDRGAPLPFMLTTLPARPLEQEAIVTVEDLVRFVRNPARELLRERLGIVLQESEGALAANEPFALDALEEYKLRQTAFAALLDGAAETQARALARAAGMLPHGHPGDALFTRIVAELEPLVTKAREFPPRTRTNLEHAFAFRRLVGVVAGAWSCHPAKLNARARLEAWVHHLARQLASGPCESIVHGLDCTLRFAPVADPEAELTALLLLRQRGLCELVPFFPKTSLAYASCRQQGEEVAMRAARKQWLGGARNESSGREESGERDQNRYVELAFRHVADPLDERFKALAREMCDPMLAACTEERA